MQSARIRPTTLIDYTSKVKNYIIEPLGHKYMAEVSSDDIKLAMVNVSSKSCSVYRSVQMLYKCIFYSAVESKIIDSCPCETLSSKGGKPQNEREALTDEQVDKLLVAIKGLPPYVFVMIGLYAGLRREEILALKWDCVFLDAEAPYLSVQRAWQRLQLQNMLLPIVMEVRCHIRSSSEYGSISSQDQQRSVPMSGISMGRKFSAR